MSDGMRDSRGYGKAGYWDDEVNVQCACGKIHIVSMRRVRDVGGAEAVREACDKDKEKHGG